MILFIIGNGFDKAHNLPTDYQKDLVSILKKNNMEKFNFINELYFNGDEKLWADFEENIGNVKRLDQLDQPITDKIQDFFTEYSDPNQWTYSSDSENYGSEDMEVENARYEAESNKPNDSDFELIYSDFKEFLDEGMEEMIAKANYQIANHKIAKIQDLHLTHSDYYLNFNYTNTLEKVYHIPANNILHIHGTLEDMIYGNKIQALSNITSNSFEIDFENYLKDDINEKAYSTSLISDYLNAIQYSDDEKEVLEKELADQVDDENFSFEKNIQIDRLKKFITILPVKIDEIVVLGHSLGEIDMPYFEYIGKKLPKVQWYISYYKRPENIDNYKKLSFSNRVKIFEFPEI